MSVFCPGEGENSRLVRRTVIRQTVLTIIELLRHISVKVKKRFPTYSHLVEAGVMTVTELRALERAQSMTDYPCYWIPITWASNIIQQAASQGIPASRNEQCFADSAAAATTWAGATVITVGDEEMRRNPSM